MKRLSLSALEAETGSVWSTNGFQVNHYHRGQQLFTSSGIFTVPTGVACAGGVQMGGGFPAVAGSGYGSGGGSGASGMVLVRW